MHEAARVGAMWAMLAARIVRRIHVEHEAPALQEGACCGHWRQDDGARRRQEKNNIGQAPRGVLDQLPLAANPRLKFEDLKRPHAGV